MYLTPWASSCG